MSSASAPPLSNLGYGSMRNKLLWMCFRQTITSSAGVNELAPRDIGDNSKVQPQKPGDQGQFPISSQACTTEAERIFLPLNQGKKSSANEHKAKCDCCQCPCGSDRTVGTRAEKSSGQPWGEMAARRGPCTVSNAGCLC